MQPHVHLHNYQQKAGEVEQAARSLINSALYYLDDPSLPDSIGNARRCLETAKSVLIGLYHPTTTAETAAVESWGFSNNVDPTPQDYPYYPI
ncbi:hypothetical protein JJB07_16335 [Tumebacillus sp. ITR2]|uniref:Uncharacterized protein n=1 Tax=Tumebacillus amylolyticus TaxID=2801339 RepID=A0ABS1JD26_9BACL|nr:hypothetical protein [Tumebacillus amylolyticus]MBL0388187.1 hypothetical protein [Tumebacillus amylolyticus]